MATEQVDLGGKPPGQFVGTDRDEAVAAVEHLRSRGLIAWLEEDFDHSRSVGGSRGEFMGFRLFAVDPQVPMLPSEGEWVVEPHSTLDKRFKIQGPGDLTLYVDYDDVDHIEVDRLLGAMLTKLGAPALDPATLGELAFRQRYVDAVENILGGEVPAQPGSTHLAGVTDVEWIEQKVAAAVLAEAVETESRALAEAAQRDLQITTVRASLAKARMACESLREAGVPAGQVYTTALSVMERTVLLLSQIEDGTYAAANPEWEGNRA